MTKFIIATIILNVAAMVGFLVVCYKANKAHQQVKRGRRPW